jgi:ribonuclease HI
LSPSADSATACASIIRDEAAPFGDESRPGYRVRDLYESQTSFHASRSRDKDDIAAYIRSLDAAWAEACADSSCLVVAADGSVPQLPGLQAVACVLLFQGGVQVDRVVSAAGRRTPPEVEWFAIQIGVSLALARGCSRLVVFSDSKPALETLLDVSVRSGQIFSLDACRALRPWLAEDGEHSVALWHSPARFEWRVQKAAHNSVVNIRIAAGPRPRTSRDFLATCSNVQAIKDWHAEFRKPSYRGANFMDLSGSKGKPVFL